MSLLEVRDLHVWFEAEGRPRVHAVRGVSFGLDRFSRLGLVGESGCGKTTTMLATMGLLPANAVVAGEIVLDGVNLLAGGEAGFRARRWTEIAIVFQGTMNALNPLRPIVAQVAEPVRVHRRTSTAAAETRALALLDCVGISRAAAGRFPHQLSGGMRQRAGIAMALACEPKVLLADEPTTALDVIMQAQVLQLLVDLAQDRGLALVIVTHDLGVVAQTCTQTAVMRAGQLVEAGPTDDLYHQPAHPYTRSLFRAVPALSPAGEAPANTGRRSKDGSGQPLLEVSDLAVHYPARRSLGRVLGRRPRSMVRAVDGVSIAVARGEMVALVGESGCGKTSTASAIVRMAPIAGGSIRFDGSEIATMGPRTVRPLRRRFQMIYQDPYESLDPRFRVLDTVAEPLAVHGIVSKEARAARVVEALTRAGLSPAEAFLHRFPHELSGGERQRVAIAASLVLEPELLIADEPVSMLDVSLRTGILTLLRDLVDRGMAMVMITHDLTTAVRYADRIAVMYLGRIVEMGPAAQVAGWSRHPYTRALLAASPRPDPCDVAVGAPLQGEAPDATAIPTGCRFRLRCPLAEAQCAQVDPELRPSSRVGDPHLAACVLA